VPDPASRCNPDGVHGASQVIEPGLFAWTDGNWRGRPWEEAIIYQLHVGAFTAQGSFAAARERLDHLVELGVTAIQLLPVGAFAGAHGWGHDGVLPFAPATSYGHPDELKDLVQTAHHKGLMVLLDLACQHFGREGNYLSVYAPAFFAAPTTGLAGRSIDCTLAVAAEFLIHAAVWNDATQEAMQDVLTGASAGAAGAVRPLDQLGACLSRGFADSGAGLLLPTAFVTFLQDHARIGDRALGERLHQLSPARPLGVLVATALLAPMPPALFMGEEFAAAQPFLYFCDFNPDLVKDIARNRRKSFAHLQGFRTARTRARIPDPTDPATFQRCKLDWNSVGRSPHAEWLDFHRRLLAVRRREICPRLAGMHEEAVRHSLIAGRGLSIRWTLGDDSVLSLLANYSGVQLDGLQRPAGSVLWAEPREAEHALTQGRLPPWSLLWFLQDAA
jgi:1,4-alpha-glucan branching enzyme